METKVYGRYRSVAEIPDLVEMQTKSYLSFLQPEIAPNRRKVEGLEALLREVFPIFSYDKTLSLEYISYELGRPRYTVEECRKLRVTFGYPFKIRVRLVKPEPVEEDIYLGEIPIMIGGGEFIVNGSERVTVSQLHRSPGIDFSVELHTGEYANATTEKDRHERLVELSRGAAMVRQAKLALNAGHGLTYRNVGPVARLEGMGELNIGHSIVSRAVLVGFTQAVREMKALLQ